MQQLLRWSDEIGVYTEKSSTTSVSHRAVDVKFRSSRLHDTQINTLSRSPQRRKCGHTVQVCPENYDRVHITRIPL
jgi:hypothetical protein